MIRVGDKIKNVCERLGVEPGTILEVCCIRAKYILCFTQDYKHYKAYFFNDEGVTFEVIKRYKRASAFPAQPRYIIS